MIFKSILKKIYVDYLKFFFKPIYLRLKIKFIQKNQQKILLRIKKKKKIKVAFFVLQDSIWKCDEIYKLMEKHEEFEPVIVICPLITHKNELNFYEEMDRVFNTFSKKSYNVVKTYNENYQWLNVKKTIQPDIIFFTYPHRLTKPQYYIYNYLDRLTCYVPYGIMIANIQQSQYNQKFHNFIWRCYYETEIHKEMAKKYALNQGKNVVVTGYPMCDIFLDKNYIPKDKWKIQEKEVKRIIWAPHHSIENNDKELAYSNFLTNYQFMLNLLEEFKGQLQIAFKPHPVLKSKLYRHPDWGLEKTNKYYLKWQSLCNGQLEEGSYEDLFLTSDAMILDSVSFISEYLYVEKPSLFLVRDETIKNKFNEYGRLCFNYVYKGYTFDDITKFVYDVVLNENDPLFSERRAFVNQYLVPVENQTASMTIFNSLISEVR